MDDREFGQFMQHLYNEYVSPRLRDVQAIDRDRSLTPNPQFRIGFLEYWRRASEACRLLRFIYTGNFCRDSFEESIAITFNAERLDYLEQEVIFGIRNHYRLAEASGFLDALDAHYQDITDGIKLEHLPKADVEVLRELGSQDPAGDLAGILAAAKSKRTQDSAAQIRSVDKFFATLEDRIAPMIHKGESDIQPGSHACESEFDRSKCAREPAPRRSRRWWKGLGTIARGCALSGANIGLAAGLLVFPVEPSTQTWGALMSSIAGVGDVLNGVGELMGE